MTALLQSWAFHLAHALWQTTLAATAILVLLRALRGTSPRLRHALAMIGIVKFVLPPMLPLPTGVFSAAPPVPELTLVRDGIASLDPRVVLALFLLHAGGAVIALARLAWEAWRLRAIVRGARPSQDAATSTRYLLSDEIGVPLTAGIFRPVILIPTTLARSLTPAELEDVLAHEAQHIRTRDTLLNTMQAIVAALWWFHPLVHRLASTARGLREERCDDALLAGGTCTRAHYARTLLQAATFVSGKAPAAAAAIAESPHSLLQRIRRISDARFTPSARLGATAVLLLLVTALLLLPGLRISASNRFAFDHATRHALHH
ncbi:MAG: M56 family metallopeptidase [Acidobacteriota bacterium]